MQRTSGMLALIVSMVCGTMAYGLQGPVRTGKAVIPHVDENLGSVNIDYEYSVRNECVFIKVRQVVVGLSGSMDGELENELRKRNILPHTQQSGSGIR